MAAATVACLAGALMVDQGAARATHASGQAAWTGATVAPAVTSQVSVSSNGVQGNGNSGDHSASADGRYVAFGSGASNLVANDTNGHSDIFVRDLVAGVTELVSVGPGGVQGDAESLLTAISADGRYVAFSSFATNLVPGDTNGQEDVFVRDRLTGVTERVSLGAGGVQGDHDSRVTSISGSGRYVGFFSNASNLVAGDTNQSGDAFVRDRVTGTTELVSVALGGGSANGVSIGSSISADGRYVAFYSAASNLTVGDTNGQFDVFVRDRLSGVTRLVSLGVGGAQSDGGSLQPVLTMHGRYVAYSSDATNLVAGDTNGFEDVFVFDQTTGLTEKVSVGLRGLPAHGHSLEPAITARGRYVAFLSFAPNLVRGDNRIGDVFVVNRSTHKVRRVSVATDGTLANGESFAPTITSHGRQVVYESAASNLVPGDINGVTDVFAWQRP